MSFGNNMMPQFAKCCFVKSGNHFSGSKPSYFLYEFVQNQVPKREPTRSLAAVKGVLVSDSNTQAMIIIHISF